MRYTWLTLHLKGTKEENITYRQISSPALPVSVCVCVCVCVYMHSCDCLSVFCVYKQGHIAYIKGTRDIPGRIRDRAWQHAVVLPCYLQFLRQKQQM